MAKTYRCPIEVRGYELDSYRHVNHSVYVNYLEHARWKLLEEEGVTLPRFDAWKRWPVIAKIEVTYLKPTYMGDRLEIETRIAERGRASIVFDQKILRGGAVVAEARVRNVIVNEEGRPAGMPEELEKRLERAL